MRKTSALHSLFPKVRRGVLAAIFTRPQQWWYLTELAHHLRTRPSSLQREIAALVASGILEHRREGTRSYFRAEARSPLFPELCRLMEKTAGLLPTLRTALAPFADEILCAFVYGSIARGKETAVSDVDLMTIGPADLAALSPALRKVEERLGREVNVTNYSCKDFRNGVAVHDHFLTAVLRGPKHFVKGSQDDLDKIVGEQKRSKTPHIEKRARQYA